MHPKIAPAALLLCLGLALAGCTKPVPAAKAAYVGEWVATGMSLLITQDGSVKYQRSKGGVSTSVEGPLQEFDGADFSVGIAMMSTHFDVTAPPHQLKDGSWKMTVDGVELTRVPQ